MISPATLLLCFGLIGTHSLQLDARTTCALSVHPDGSAGCLRLFHPAFLTELLNPVSSETAENMVQLKKSLGTPENIAQSYEEIEKKGLPWKILPAIGVSDFQNVMPKSEISESFERYGHYGHIVWAHKIDKIEKGCVLLNHWKQDAILITSYEPSKGASGVKLTPAGTRSTEKFEWPSLALEIELRERKWQLAAVSNNILS
eukprot:gene38519-50587_t